MQRFELDMDAVAAVAEEIFAAADNAGDAVGDIGFDIR